MGAIDITSSVAIDAPAADTWEVVADFARNPEWQRGMRKCSWLTDPPTRVGSRYQQMAKFLGREIHTTFEVVELEEGSSVTIDTVEGTFPITVTRSVAPTASGCEVTAHVRGDAGRLFRIFSPLLRRMVQRSVDGDYKRLKELLEAD